MTKNPKEQHTKKTIRDQRFDEPLYVDGEVTHEPETYLAEKPYELSEFEFSVLRKGQFKSNIWFELVFGATIGFVLNIAGKTLSALIQKETPSVDKWELWSIGVGIVLALLLRFRKRNSDEKEFNEIKDYINQHFKTSLRRRVHIPRKEEE